MVKGNLKMHPDKVPVSDLTLKGMTWSSDDKQFFKRGLDYHSEKIKRYVEKQLTKEFDRVSLQLSEALIARDKIMFEKMDEQTFIIKNVREDIILVKKDLLHVKADITGIKEQQQIMKNHYEEKFLEIGKLLEVIRKRNRIVSIILRLAVTSIITAAASIFIIKYLHDHYWSIALLSYFRTW